MALKLSESDELQAAAVEKEYRQYGSTEISESGGKRWVQIEINDVAVAVATAAAVGLAHVAAATGGHLYMFSYGGAVHFRVSRTFPGVVEH